MAGGDDKLNIDSIIARLLEGRQYVDALQPSYLCCFRLFQFVILSSSS